MSDDVQEPTVPDLSVVEADLAAVDRALARLEDGTYGRCVACGVQIDATHLDSEPLRDRCERHREPAEPARVGVGVADQTASASGGVESP